MNINFGLAKYSYKLIVTIMACLIPEERMARASKFLRESEQTQKPKTPQRKEPIKKNNSP